jgi:hypothetical protein
VEEGCVFTHACQKGKGVKGPRQQIRGTGAKDGISRPK